MNLRRTALAAAATIMAVGGLSFGAAAPASAITRAYPCNGNDTGDFLEFYSPASACFAGRGYENVKLYDVWDVASGNNYGIFYDHNLGSFVEFVPYIYIPANANWYPGHYVTYVCIEPAVNDCPF